MYFFGSRFRLFLKRFLFSSMSNQLPILEYTQTYLLNMLNGLRLLSPRISRLDHDPFDIESFINNFMKNRPRLMQN